jgi:hypothetical protein
VRERLDDGVLRLGAWRGWDGGGEDVSQER